MKVRRKPPAEPGGSLRREDFATWTDYEDAVMASDDLDDIFRHLLALPQTLEDWIDAEETHARRWYAQHTADPSIMPPLEAYLARARERARESYEATRKDNQ